MFLKNLKITQVTNLAGGSGDNWVDLENTNQSNPNWQKERFILSDYITLTNQVQFRFIASDLSYPGDVGSGGSLVEAGIDDFMLEAIGYDCEILGDFNCDGFINVIDVIQLVDIIISSQQNSEADINGDNTVNVLDIIVLVNVILEN